MSAEEGQSRVLERLRRSGAEPLMYDDLQSFEANRTTLEQHTFKALGIDPKYGSYEFIGKYLTSEAEKKFVQALQDKSEKALKRYHFLPSSQTQQLCLYYNLSLDYPELGLFRGDNFSTITGWSGLDFSQGDLDLVMGQYTSWRRKPIVVEIPIKNILPLFAGGLLRAISSEGHILRNSTVLEFSWGNDELEYANRDRILKFAEIYQFDSERAST